MSSPSIAIIGAGASGTLLAIHLLDQPQPPRSISLFDRSPGNFGRGVAYAPRLNYAPLNVPASGMSAFKAYPEHFLEWVKIHRNPKAQPGDFISRLWYGDYLCDLLNRLRISRPECQVQFLHEEVKEVIKNPDNTFDLKTTLGRRSAFSKVVLCTGNRPPELPSNIQQHSDTRTIFWNNPWEFTADQAMSFENILILGTGLTMVDWVVSLKHLGFKGKIAAFSRGGRLPLVHQHPMSVTTPDEDLSSADIPRLFQYLRSRVKRSPEIPWQYILDGIRPYISQAWRATTDQNKRLFLHRMRKFWEVHRHRIPQASADEISRMIATGMLSVYKGKLELLKAEDGFLSARMGDLGNHLFAKIGLVINCTGPDPSAESDPFLSSLLRSDLAGASALGLGLICDAHGQINNAQSKTTDGLYCIGPVRKAMDWETTAVREIREQAENLATLLSASSNPQSDYFGNEKTLYDNLQQN